MSALIKIQQELKAPKNQFNSFGKYKYRSCEDILEAVKPVLKKHDCALILSDDVIGVGNRVYVRSTAKLVCYGTDGTQFTVESSDGWAREAENKKGMDDSQITGTASSYARKYALNGLFCIDDNKDNDSNEQRVEQNARADDDKPWYNDFDAHKDAMLAGVKSGEKTTKSIIENLEKKYKLSKAVKADINKLGAYNVAED